MDTITLYKIHHHSINNLILVYVIIIALLIVAAYVVFHYNEKPFYRSMFFTLLVSGIILIISALSLRAKNIREIAAMEVQHPVNEEKFLLARYEEASGYKVHFYRLLTIWCVALVFLGVLSIVFLEIGFYSVLLVDSLYVS